MKYHLFRAVVASVLLAAAYPAAGELVLYAPGSEPAPITSRSFEGDDRRFQMINAGRLLAGYLEKICGATFKVDRGALDTSKPHILIERVRREELGGGKRDSFLIDVTEQGVLLRANSERAAFFMVFEFLHRHLDCQWLSPTEEIVPTRKRIALKPGRVEQVPAFDYFHLYNLEATQGYHQFQIRGYGTLRFTGNHTLYPLLKKACESNPHFYPMNKDGQRKPNQIHFCYLADGIVDALVDALAAEVEKRNGNIEDYIYFAGMGDWYGGTCQCDACKAVYEEEAWDHPDGRRLPGVAATLLRMINASAQKLEERYPGIQVGTFAYMSLEAPPARTAPRSNVHIWMPRLRHDTVRPVDDPASGNASYFASLKRWCELAPGRVHVWDYGANFENFLMPFPCLRSIARNIQVYHQLGVAGVMVQGNYVSTGGDQIVLKNAVYSSLLADPSQDAEALIDAFCRTYYGPAAPMVDRYLRAMEAGSLRSGKPIDEMNNPRKTFLDDALLGELEGIMSQAMAAAGENPDYQRRVRELGAGLEAARLWGVGPLEEKDGRLIRTDLGGDTYERAKLLEAHLRGASPREWGDGYGYRLDFLRGHGGPIHTFKQGKLEVKVAPVQRGRVGPVKWDGQTVIVESWDEPSLGVRMMESVGEIGAKSIAMEGPVGTPHWGWSTFIHTGRREFELDSAEAYTVRSLLQRQTKTERPCGLSARYEFHAKSSDGRPSTVAWRDAQGTWAAVEPGHFKKPNEAGPALAVRAQVGDAAIHIEWTLPDSPGSPGSPAPLQISLAQEEKTRNLILKIIVPDQLRSRDAMQHVLTQTVRFSSDRPLGVTAP